MFASQSQALSVSHDVPNMRGRGCYLPSQDIFRKYPNEYENIITTLCENLDELDEPEAKASMVLFGVRCCSSGTSSLSGNFLNLSPLCSCMALVSQIWIIGEYSARIDNADELLSIFADTFEDEVPEVSAGRTCFHHP